jgi:hypothetical protein
VPLQSAIDVPEWSESSLANTLANIIRPITGPNPLARVTGLGSWKLHLVGLVQQCYTIRISSSTFAPGIAFVSPFGDAYYVERGLQRRGLRVQLG